MKSVREENIIWQNTIHCANINELFVTRAPEFLICSSF